MPGVVVMKTLLKSRPYLCCAQLKPEGVHHALPQQFKNYNTRPLFNAVCSLRWYAVNSVYMLYPQMVEGYLNGFCCNLNLHTITDVQTSDRVSLLLKDSFIESFPAKDRAFIKMFVETQMFSVYCDTILQ